MIINQFHIIGGIIGIFIGREIAYRIINYIERRRLIKQLKLWRDVAKVIGEPIDPTSPSFNIIEAIENEQTKETENEL